MSKYINIQGQKVKVTKELYKDYYKMDRRHRYLEEDIKVGSTKIDPETGRVIYIPSKEDSIERLTEAGAQFQDDQSIEDIVCDKAILLVLKEARKELSEEEQKVISALYNEELTTREAGEVIEKSHVTVGRKEKQALKKLKEYLVKKGYEDSGFIN